MKRHGSGDIDARIERVLAKDACSGCGACTLIDDGIKMRLDENGYLRPRRMDPSSSPRPEDGRVFSRVCPGERVPAPPVPASVRVHPMLGPYLEIWQAWATDPELRLRGSSGGTLTALTEWLISSGQAYAVTGAAADTDPRRSVPVTITTRDEALRAAGSRYTPVAAASNEDTQNRAGAVVGKPCDVAALRALGRVRPSTGDPLMLSFFCAGTPSAHATSTLVTKLGFASDSAPDELWYRGNGWPGRFTVSTGGRTASMSYDESWGGVLGRTTQWRCKVCVDGTGEHADIVAADSWASDANGYPIFADGEGMSALIARTARGRAVIRAAIDAGVIEAVDYSIDDLARIQPLQVDRRRYLWARIVGAWFAGRHSPRYSGYRGQLLRLTLRSPRQSLRVARGTWQRVRRSTRPTA